MNTELIECINNITRYMKGDFKLTYPKDDKEYKNRLYKALNGFDIDDIYEAYENYEKCNDEPSVPEMARMVANLRPEKKKEIKAVETKPKEAKLKRSPIQLLHDAVANSGKVPLKQRREEHEALIARHYKEGKIKRPVDTSGLDPDRHTCSIGFCTKVGTKSSGTLGDGKYYCSEHFIQSA